MELAIALPELVRELDQPAHEVLLTWLDRGQAFLVSISRSELTAFAKQPLSPSDQNFLVEKNLETLAPVIAGKRELVEVTQRTDPRTGRTLPLIELTRKDLDQGLRRYPVVSDAGMPVEALATVVDENGEALGTWSVAKGSWVAQGGTAPDTAAPPFIGKLRRSEEEVTILSCGIVGSAMLSGSMGESVYSKLRREFRNAVAIETRRYGAVMAVAMGDAHIATFGSGTLKEGHALRALRAAQAIQQTLSSYLDPEVATLPVQIGLHTAIARMDPVRIATALEERAGAGGILLTRATLEAAGDYAAANHVERRQIGIGEPIEIFRLIRILEPSPAEALDDRGVTESIEQRPAAYRFTSRKGQIDVLPEPPDAEDREFALDAYNELVFKARELLDRLKGTNSARRACDTIQRLMTALGTKFDDLRPGVLLSRVRSIEVDRAAFEGELFADAFAMLDDTLQSARDLMAAFPIVRRIEAERLALDLDRHPHAVPILREGMDEIKSAAEQLPAATEQAIDALIQNDVAIEEATDLVLRTSLVADKLLVVRNFLSATAGALAKLKSELGEVGGESWAAIRTELPKGVGFAARVAPFMGLVTLTGLLAGPVAGIAAVVPGFNSIATAFKKFAMPEAAEIPKLKPKARPKTKARR